MDKNYGGVVWTNHALQRLNERRVTQGDAWATFNRPDQSRYAQTKGAWIYYKTYGDQRIEVVAKKDEKGKWIILSVWSRPVFQKTSPHYTKTKDSLILKILKTIFGVK
ncbi:MAG: DUF4258 domain-containing protein [Candidatus Woesebacteria bacterium]|nr:MAG: DUF4258 domain-containing protein [Candidatus Woesebacteria bacterium]